MFKIVYKEGEREREMKCARGGPQEMKKMSKKIKTQEEIMYAHIDKKEVKLDLGTKKVILFF